MNEAVKQRLRTFAKLVRTSAVAEYSGPLSLGVDLGTANIVLSVVDGADRPVAGASRHSVVVRDGIVVDWVGAVAAVTALKDELSAAVGRKFGQAAVTVPPGMDPGTIKVFTNVLEAAALGTRAVIDEPVAAALALGVRDGCVIDIGHGTTGVSVLSGGAVRHSMDEPTGGHHMTLTLAGALGVSYSQAEKLKTSGKQAELVFGIIRPVLQKMATIAKNGIDGTQPKAVYLVGGASSFPGAAAVFSEIIGQRVTQTVEPLYVTPLGAAMRGVNDE